MTIKKRFALTFAAILIFSILGYSQEWKGKGRIKGVVLGESGEPVIQAKIILTHAELNAKVEKTTDKKGEFTASWITGGIWYIDVEAAGYAPGRISVTVSEIRRDPPVKIILKQAEKTFLDKQLADAVSKLENEAIALLEQKKFDEAAAKYKEILEKTPELYEVNLSIGRCYMMMGDYESAILHFERVLAKEPGNKDAIMRLGNAYLEMGELEKGLSFINKLSDEDITSPHAFYNIGALFFNKGKPEAAAQYFERAINLDTKMADAYYQLGMCYMSSNKKEKAKENFLIYLEIDPASDKARRVKTFLKFLNKGS